MGILKDPAGNVLRSVNGDIIEYPDNKNHNRKYNKSSIEMGQVGGREV